MYQITDDQLYRIVKEKTEAGRQFVAEEILRSSPAPSAPEDSDNGEFFLGTPTPCKIFTEEQLTKHNAAIRNQTLDEVLVKTDELYTMGFSGDAYNALRNAIQPFRSRPAPSAISKDDVEAAFRAGQYSMKEKIAAIRNQTLEEERKRIKEKLDHLLQNWGYYSFPEDELKGISESLRREVPE